MRREKKNWQKKKKHNKTTSRIRSKSRKRRGFHRVGETLSSGWKRTEREVISFQPRLESPAVLREVPKREGELDYI